MKNLIIYNPNTFKFSEKFEVNDKDSLNVSRWADIPKWLHKVFNLVRPRTFAVPLLSENPSDRFALVAQTRSFPRMLIENGFAEDMHMHGERDGVTLCLVKFTKKYWDWSWSHAEDCHEAWLDRMAAGPWD